jgi:hypothetical protein
LTNVNRIPDIAGLIRGARFVAIAINVGRWAGAFARDSEALLRLQNILLQAAEGVRSDELNSEYQTLRKGLLSNPEYADLVPRMVRTSRDLTGVWAEMKAFADQWEPRRAEVRNFMGPLLDRAEEFEARAEGAAVEPARLETKSTSSDWTGSLSSQQRMAVARDLLPIVRASLESLIKDLQAPGHNGGPILDDQKEAIDNLKRLHAVIGEILEACEDGSWDEVVTQGLPAQASRYAKRAAKLLKEDPMPYAVSALMLGIFHAAGFPEIGGYLAGIALTVPKGAQPR